MLGILFEIVFHYNDPSDLFSIRSSEVPISQLVALRKATNSQELKQHPTKFEPLKQKSVSQRNFTEFQYFCSFLSLIGSNEFLANIIKVEI